MISNKKNNPAINANRIVLGNTYYMWKNLSDQGAILVQSLGWFDAAGEQVDAPLQLNTADPSLTLHLKRVDNDEILVGQLDQNRRGAVYLGGERMTFHGEHNIRYWWVNHKQTHKQEIDSKYIWAPKVNKAGKKSHFYDNLMRVGVGDVVLSYANGLISHIGLATGVAVTSRKPEDFGSAGENWADEGWLVPIEWHLLEKPVDPRDKLPAIASLFPNKYSPFSVSENRGNQGAYLASISERLAFSLISSQETDKIRSMLKTAEAISEENEVIERQEDQIEAGILADATIPETEKLALVKSRRGQGKYRENVASIEAGCRVTGITNRALLRASHIKPWRSCENADERLDKHNGFLLSPSIDHLFDKGYITFDPDGLIVSSDAIASEDLETLGCFPGERVKGPNFSKEQEVYLAHHRTNVFRLPGK